MEWYNARMSDAARTGAMTKRPEDDRPLDEQVRALREEVRRMRQNMNLLLVVVLSAAPLAAVVAYLLRGH